jgi:hypothetical protein
MIEPALSILWYLRIIFCPLSTFLSIGVLITFLWNPRKLFPCLHVSFIFYQALCDVIYNAHHLEAIAMWDSLQNGSTTTLFALHDSNAICVALGMNDDLYPSIITF